MINKLVAIVMMIVSACLILISFLILRFTIVFTVQEDYREIGVMKAIGIRSIGIGPVSHKIPRDLADRRPRGFS
jgi:putative ABC transport system permease protein